MRQSLAAYFHVLWENYSKEDVFYNFKKQVHMKTMRKISDNTAFLIHRLVLGCLINAATTKDIIEEFVHFT